jgi:hypothetical protein
MFLLLDYRLHFNCGAVQVGSSRQFYFDGEIQPRPGTDLIIAEYPDGLSVPGVSSPSSQIPKWNAHVDGFLRIIVGFAGKYLHDDGALLLFYPDNPKVKKELFSFFKLNKLKMKVEWTIVNTLHLRQPLNASNLVSSLLRYLISNMFDCIGISSLGPQF